MKKYLMTGVAALAFAATFTSCSKAGDLYDEGAAKEAETQKQTEQILASYNQAFLKTFGQPAADQDWGFGTSTVAGTRAVSGITFPTFKDGVCPAMPTKYYNTVAEVEANVSYFTGDVNNKSAGDVFYIDSNSTLYNTQNRDNLTIYVVGNVTYLGSTSQNNGGTTFCVTEGSTLKLGQVSERLTIYLASNATLDITEQLDQQGNPAPTTSYVWNAEKNANDIFVNNTFTFTKDNAALYMSAGSHVNGDVIYFKDGYTVLNQGGTISANELHVENGAVLYNKNQITATGVIALRNTNGEIDNFGTMTGASMTLDANARFYNVAGGNVTITGLTKINNDSGNNAWQNSGQFNTGSFEITGGCQDPAAFNNCHMSVTGKFFMNHGNFVLDGGAAVECGSFEWQSDNFFHMGGKALLKVEGQLLANNKNNSPQYGFWGDATDYAVIQAGSIVKGSEGKCRAAYYGNLFIDTDNHFTQGENSADGTWYTFGDNVKFSFTDNTDVTGFQTHDAKTAQKAKNFSITIPRDNNGCTPGYKYGDDDPDPSSDIVRVICEDLSVKDDTDWDFNDAVFDVQLFDNNSKVKITLRAAGGTLPLYIGNDNEAVEIHAKFKEFNPGLSISTGTMLSTGTSNSTGKYAYTGCAVPSYFINNTFGSTNVKEVAKNIPIKVQKLVNGEMQLILLECEKGKATAKVAVNENFDWCDEREHINEKYRNYDEYGNEYGGFSLFVQGIFSADEWYNYNGPLTPEMVEQLGQ